MSGTNEVTVTDPKTGGQKGQKDERFDLLPMDALEEVARVYGIGARKYADDNWLKGYRWRLSLGALLRHVSRFMIGEDRDQETGCLHLAHAAWHCLTLLTFYMRKLGTDDRAPAIKPAPTYQEDGGESSKFFEILSGCRVTHGERMRSGVVTRPAGAAYGPDYVWVRFDGQTCETLCRRSKLNRIPESGAV